ncbi:MAG TPA: oxygenase MpaB family protein [Myxococcota bacterium]|jgi:uncharacterized protein (DUF2236 family)
MGAMREEAPGGPLARLRRSLAAQLEETGGRHDEAEIYGGPAGDPGLAGGPGSISWEIHADLASLAVAGSAAVLMELLHPSVMAGVYTQSSYRTEPLRRARNTLGYVLRTTFGNTLAATDVIAGVRRVHARVRGQRADGVSYCALDSELIAWVHTCIPWAVMTAFDRYARPLSREERDRYLREQAVIGRMGGADWVPESVSALEEYVERMRPKLAFSEQTLSFLDFLAGRSAEQPAGRAERFDRWTGIRASMSLMPDWAQRLTGTRQPRWLQRAWLRPSDRLKAGLVRFALPELPCVRMAHERAHAGTPLERFVAA